MTWTYFWYGLGGLALLYFITATVFLLVARIKKDKDGNLILDSNSRHFKLSYPFLKFQPKSFIEGSLSNIGICGYFFKFFFMLYVGWPILAVLASIKTVTYLPFMLLFGFYPIANHRSIYEEKHSVPFLLDVDAGEIRFLQPKIKGVTIFPFYAIVPLSYILAWIYYSDRTWNITFWCLVMIAVIAAIVGAIVLFFWLKETDEGNVSLFREWIGAEWNRFCPRMKLKVT